MIWLFICLPLAAYALGSLSFAWIAAKLKGVDLRQHGSGNLGATNAGRVLGMHWFFIVFCCDVAKGLLPVLAASWLPTWCGLAPDNQTRQLLMIGAAVAAILGHVFTCFHGFRGGKAVATSLGVLIALDPLLAACLFGVFLLVWLIAAFAFKAKKSDAVGPGSVLASGSVIPLRFLLVETPFGPDERVLSIFLGLLSLLVIWRHRSNIRTMLSRGSADPTPCEGDAGSEPDTQSAS